MDILSIRKKKGAKGAAPPPSPAATPEPSPLQPPPPAALVARSPESRPATPAPTPALPAAHQALEPPRVAKDPLEGFLARYDEHSDRDDDFIGVRAAAADAGERYLSFHIAGEAYAASIMDIREILTIRSLTDVPRAPREILGVISKRGVVLPVIDLAAMLSLRPPDRRLRAAQRVLVVGDGDRTCGLRVDRVSEVFKLAAHQIEGVPPSVGAKNAGMLLGLGRLEQALYIFLDLPALLDAFAASLGLPPARSTRDGHLE